MLLELSSAALTTLGDAHDHLTSPHPLPPISLLPRLLSLHKVPISPPPKDPMTLPSCPALRPGIVVAMSWAVMCVPVELGQCLVRPHPLRRSKWEASSWDGPESRNRNWGRPLLSFTFVYWPLADRREPQQLALV